MFENCLTQKQYDHRLRRLIQTTGDLDLTIRHGVPRSTTRGWLRQSRTVVVSIDVLDMDAEVGGSKNSAELKMLRNTGFWRLQILSSQPERSTIPLFRTSEPGERHRGGDRIDATSSRTWGFASAHEKTPSDLSFGVCVNP